MQIITSDAEFLKAMHIVPTTFEADKPLLVYVRRDWIGPAYWVCIGLIVVVDLLMWRTK